MIESFKMFPEYSGYKKDRTPVVTAPSLDQDEMITSIFAPDPVSGTPRSDLGIVMSADKSPVVSQYIRDTLMSPHHVGSQLTESSEDGDFALASMKSKFESVEEYSNRLRQLLESKSE